MRVKRRLNGTSKSEQTDRERHTQTHIWTYRLKNIMVFSTTGCSVMTVKSNFLLDGTTCQLY